MKLFIFCLVFLINYSVIAQKNDHKLTNEVQKLVTGFKGDMGIYIHNLRTNKIVAINADTVFPTASMVKIPILMGIMKKIKSKELNYHSELKYKDSLFYSGGDILGSYKHNETIELSKILMLMLTTSDNTASLWLQGLANAVFINEILDSLDFKNTKINSRVIGREAFKSKYGWGQTTPKEMALLLKMMVDKKLFSVDESDKMIRLLGRNLWDEQAISQIPSNVFVASKNGAVNASRSEVLYVNHKKNPYIFCICTKNNIDTSWNDDNEAWETTKKISKLLWDYFDK